MWPNPKETVDLVTLTGEILNGKLHFLCSEVWPFEYWETLLGLVFVKKGTKWSRVKNKLFSVY